MDKSNRHRLIVGIDYGTTFSGISYVTTDKSGIEDINVITSWPEATSLSAWKTPTCIAYAAENVDKGLQEDLWGFAVRPNLTSCSWTKLLFDTSNTVHDDPSIRTAIDNGILHLPAGKKADRVCADFLLHLRAHFWDIMKKQIGEDFLQSTPMDCWITVPAVWDDRAQDMTKAAVKLAGFASRPDDQIFVIPEPEAAAVSVLKSYLKPQAPNSPMEGEAIMICDCGGGTVDITTYAIVETSPLFVFEELCIGNGGKCGSTYIDRNLHKLMEKRFGDNFSNLEPRKKGPGSRFMNDWDRVKRSFGMNNAGSNGYEIQLIMTRVRDSEWYDADEGMVKLSRFDIDQLFRPVVEQVLLLISEQLKSVEEEQKKINRLVLVGGFGDSAFLFNEVKEWCSTRHIQVLCPNDPQAAIVRGAALRGLEGIAPRKRRCRRHYGVDLLMDFRPGTDSEDLSCNIQYGKESRKMCKNRMHWIINKGSKVVQNEKRTVKQFFTWDRHKSKILYVPIFSCILDEAPEYCHDKRVQRVATVKVDFSEAPKELFEHKRDHGWYGTKRYVFKFALEISFGGSSSNLQIKSLVENKVTGVTTLEFD